jgi:hypothetical protein
VGEKWVWIDGETHWQAYGEMVNGQMIDAQVDDNRGSTRIYSKTLNSEQDFERWVRGQAAPM